MILSEIRILEEKMAKPIRNRDSASLLYLGLYFELLRIAEIGSFGLLISWNTVQENKLKEQTPC